MTTNNSINSIFSNEADGFIFGGGTTTRRLTLSGGDIVITGIADVTINTDGDTGQVWTSDGLGGISFTSLAPSFNSSLWKSDSNTTAAPPIDRRLQWDNLTQASATEIRIDDQNSAGVDLSAFLLLILADDFIRIQIADDPNVFQVWQVTVATNETGFMRYAVTLIEAEGGNISNNRSILVTAVTQASGGLVIPGGADGDVQFKNGTSFNGESGLNWDSAADRLVITGDLRYVDGNQADGFVLTSDGSGNATWQVGGLIPWTEVTTTTFQMVINNGYISNNAAVVELTLPVSPVIGDVIQVAGKGAGGWIIKQNAGQQIHFGNVDTIVGSGGTLESVDNADSIALVCTTATTDWTVFDPQGNVNVVDVTVFDEFSMLFDGVDECLNMDPVIGLLGSDTIGTWSTWFKTPDVTDSGAILAVGDADGNTELTLFNVISGKLQLIYRNAGTIEYVLRSDNVEIVNDTWIHVAVVQDGVEPIIYVDSVAVAQTFLVSSDKTAWYAKAAGFDTFRFACRNNNSAGDAVFYIGNQDEMSIWNTDLTSGQITEIYNSGTPADLSTHSAVANLRSWNRMGDLATFDSGNWYFPEAKSGLDNARSLLFDGVDERVDIVDVLTNELASTTVGTWSAWVKPVDATPSVLERFIGFGDTNAVEEIQMYITSDGKLNALARVAGTSQWHLETDAAAFSDGQWTHAAVVQDGVSPVLYVDGIAVAQTFTITVDKTSWFADGTGLDTGNIACLDFNSAGPDLFFNGNMDEVSFWDDDFTSGEITELYADGSPEDLTSHSKSANLSAWFRMGDGDTLPTIIDNSTNTNDGTAVNMEAADNEFDAPLLGVSINMENGDRVGDTP